MNDEYQTLSIFGARNTEKKLLFWAGNLYGTDGSQKYLLHSITTDFLKWKLKKLTCSLSYQNSLYSLMIRHQFFCLLKERFTFRNTILSGRYQRHRCRFRETYSYQFTPAEKDKFKKVIKVHLHAFDKSTSFF